MLKFKPITLEDKDLINDYFSRSNFINAEKNFSNLYMWRNCYNYEYLEINNYLCVRGKTKDNIRFYHFPYGDLDKDALDLILNKLIENDDELLILIKPILPEMKEYLENSSINFDIEEDRDAFDYIYDSNKLLELKGKHLRSKRRWVKKFLDNYDYTYEEITPENLEDAKDFTLNAIKNTNDDAHELSAMSEMFDNLFKLNINGCIIRVDGNIVGVSTGEVINSDCVLIHCERCDTTYEGIYKFINNIFIKEEWVDYKYINREEDLGIEGLRYAKLSYQPDCLLTKYIAKYNK